MNRMPLPVLICLAMIAVLQPAMSQIREVKVTGGMVKGDFSDGVSAFKGIPFAAPPTGGLRWKAPLPVQAWTGVRKANSFGPACMQTAGNLAKPMGSTEKVSEDCLYLNVWTAAKEEGEKRPVMVWIHGGGFTGGMTSTPMYDGTILAKRGAVLVSVAYRVGPFGFLAHPELSRESGKGSGNYGLQDVIAGLQWVKENIARFGGDPDCVTIFGQSAGGNLVSMLNASPAAKGLYHRAIAESGASFAPPYSWKRAGQTVPTLSLAESTGVNFLKELGVDGIGAARALKASKIQNSPSSSVTNQFWPVADGDILPGDQFELYLAGRFNDTPILVGSNSDEGAAFSRGRPASSAKVFMQYVRNNFGPDAAAILNVYPHSSDSEAAQSARDIGRDNIFAWHTYAWAALQAQKGTNRAFVYYFDHRTPNSPGGADHGAEVSYVFGNFRSFGGGPGEEDRTLAGIMGAYWVNFARSGDPNGEGLPVWPAFSEKEPNAMYFGDKSLGARPLPNMEKLKVFDRYYARRRMEAKANVGR